MLPVTARLLSRRPLSLWLGVCIALFCAHYAHGQVAKIDIPAGKKLGPPPVKPRPPAAQRELFLKRAARIRSHHRPVPLQESVTPLSTALTSAKVAIRPRSLEAQIQNEMNIIRQQSVTGSASINYDYASPISEPTVASRGEEVLVTGNWYAAMSTDGGKTFQYVDPYSYFERAGIPEDFCCDQVAAYDRDTDAIFWLMQGAVDNARRGNRFVLLIARGQQDIRAQNWFYYDLPSTTLLGKEGLWFDFPDLAFSDRHVYVTTNVFSTTDNSWQAAVVMRLDKRQLASYQHSAADVVALQTGSLRLSHGARDTVYWVGHNTTSTIQLWRWPDSESAPRAPVSVDVETWIPPDDESTKSAVAPNKRPWLRRADGRITAAWTAKGHVGFAWGVGADNRYSFPHVRVAVVQEDAIAKAGFIGRIQPTIEPHIWSNSFGIGYPSAMPNSEGTIGIAVAYGGPKNYPGYAIGFFKDGFSEAPALTRVRESRNTPICPKEDGTRDFTCGVWGDYFSLRTHGSNPQTWVTVGYTVQNEDHEKVKAESEFVWFDRRREIIRSDGTPQPALKSSPR